MQRNFTPREDWKHRGAVMSLSLETRLDLCRQHQCCATCGQRACRVKSMLDTQGKKQRRLTEQPLLKTRRKNDLRTAWICPVLLKKNYGTNKMSMINQKREVPYYLALFPSPLGNDIHRWQWSRRVGLDTSKLESVQELEIRACGGACVEA